MQKISKNTKDTEQIAKDFIELLSVKNKEAYVVGLYGDLGTGKTTFTQFVAKNFGIKRKINSPTFVIMKKYKIATRSLNEPSDLVAKFKYLFHLDAYRLKNEKELLHLGWKEIISNPEHLVFIEWPENIKKVMPKKHHKIHISHTKKGYRKFEIKQS